MSFDTVSYIMGNKGGYTKGYDAGHDAGYTEGYSEGYEQGEEDGASVVIIEGGITCTDANNDGNVVITEG